MLRKSRRQFADAPNSEFQEQQYHTPPEDQEIPLPDLGKLVKGLWRSVSRGHGGKEKNAHETPRPMNSTTFTEGINTSAADHDDGEGGVWMEEVAWATSSDPSSPALSRSSSTEDTTKRDSRRDTVCTVDSGSFLDELDGIGEIQARQQLLGLVTEEGSEFGGGAHKDLGSCLAGSIPIS
jgi:hypothetical protein